jgi:hypothetical protein
MKLNQYPKAIAEIESKILAASREVEIQIERISFLDGEIEAEIAADLSLKNEQNRKAKRLELQQQPDYLEALAKLKEVKEQKERLTIELNQLRNEFSVAKLETRMTIAQLEATA